MSEFLDVKGAAAALGVGERTIYDLCKEWRESMGKRGIPHVMIGGKTIRTTIEDVRKWYEGQKRAVARDG